LSLILAKKKLLMAQTGGVNIIGVAIQSGVDTHTRIDVDGNTLSGAQYDLGGSYYDTHGAFAFADEIIDGQNMVKIPAMYYRRAPITSGVHSGKEGWWVADGPVDGFVLHPAFMREGSPIDHFWLGKYQAVGDGGTKLGSFGGSLPIVSQTSTAFSALADARNTGGNIVWFVWSFYHLAVMQMLLMIETASTDCQAVIGNGRVSATSAANVDASDVAEASYRGVVGIWGNVGQLVLGLDYSAGIVRMWDRNGYKSYVSTGISTKPGTNYPSVMQDSTPSGIDFRDVFFPSVTSAVASSTWRDRCNLSYTSNRSAVVGGAYGVGAIAGIWCMDLSSTNGSGAAIGSRLAKEP
jgi:hypothetical protein